ncbi:MAG: hypothetical protein R2867_44940 [Caldilineaceae bacterium]
MLKRILPFLMMMSMLLAACAPVQQAAAPAAPAEGNDAAAATTGSDYLDSLNARIDATYDTAAFKKDGPYRIALAAQGPTNAWATLFDEHARLCGRRAPMSFLSCSMPTPMAMPTRRYRRSKICSARNRMP